ncbi:hypothetical protein Bbelb_445210, partial [Branchiostoma belcheri]
MTAGCCGSSRQEAAVDTTCLRDSLTQKRAVSVISKANASEERLAAGGFIGQVLPRTEPLLRQNTKPDGFSRVCLRGRLVWVQARNTSEKPPAELVVFTVSENFRTTSDDFTPSSRDTQTGLAGSPGPGLQHGQRQTKYREAAMKDEVISQFSRDSYLTGSSCSHPDLNSALLTFGVRTCEGTTASGFGCTTINYENTGRQFRPALVKDSTLRHYRVVLNQNEPRLTLRAPASPSPILSARAADRPGQARSLHYVASINSFATVKTIKRSPFNSLLNSDAILHLLNLYEGQTAAQTRKGNKFIGKDAQAIYKSFKDTEAVRLKTPSQKSQVKDVQMVAREQPDNSTLTAGYRCVGSTAVSHSATEVLLSGNSLRDKRREDVGGNEIPEEMGQH